MTDDTIDERTGVSGLDLPRRKVLGALGTIGAAGALGGASTMAFFSDEEAFANNQLTAGELDLKVSWAEHYYDGRGEETQYAHREDGALVIDDREGFMDATLLEQFPDKRTRFLLEEGSADPCEVLADVPDDLQRPVLDVTDVKPGDFGEVTFDFSLCDNPGYVWMNGALHAESENGMSEPERKDPDESGGEPGELADALEVTIWYDDDCDNVLDGGSSQLVDLVIVFDASESMNALPGGAPVEADDDPGKLTNAVAGAQALVDSVGSGTNLGLGLFSDLAHTNVVRNLGSAPSDVKDDLADLDGPDAPTNSLVDDDDTADQDNLVFETRMEDGIRDATAELTGANARSGAEKVMVILSDGEPFPSGQDVAGAASDAEAAGIEIYTIAYGSGADTSLMASLASDPANAFVAASSGDIVDAFEDVGRSIAGEEVIFEGSFRDAMGHLSANDGRGVPLDGNRDTPFDELADPEDDPNRDCYTAAPVRHCVGFEWSLPVDHANEVQTDSVTFDLGFYGEQCRHNDGSGVGSTPEEDDDEPIPEVVSISASPDAAGEADSVHRVDVPVGSALDGAALSSLTVDYPNGEGFDVSGVDAGDVLGAGIERTDSSITGLSVSGTAVGDGGTSVTFSFGGGEAISSGDTVFVEYRDVTNASSADDYPVVVDVNGGEVGPGPLTITPSSGTPQTVTTTFDDDHDGWKIVGDAQGGSSVPDFESAAGNPAPCISATDDVQGGVWYFEAPGKYLGDKSGHYGGTLSFDLQQEFSGSPSQFSAKDVRLVGGGTTLTLDFGDSGTHPGNGTWTSYSVSLDESEDWETGSGSASASEIQSVLSDLTVLRIRGEYRTGSDKGYLDNVSMAP